MLKINPDGIIAFVNDDGLGHALWSTKKTNVSNGLWHHIAAVRDGSKSYIYVDGKQISTSLSVAIATYTAETAPPVNINNSIRLLIGAVDQIKEPYQHFSGTLCEVRMWNIARSQDDILATMERKLKGSEDGLVGYWPGDLGIMLDFSPTRNTSKASGVMTTTNAPSMSVPSDELVTVLFAGRYDSQVKYQGAWHDHSPVYLTNADYFVIGDNVILNPNIQGNTISWDWEDNPTKGSITFYLGSRTGKYSWPDGDNSFQGWIQFDPSQAKQDFNGRMVPPFSPCYFIQSAESGLIIDAGAATEGNTLTTQKMSPDSHQHFCVSADGKIVHMLSQLAVTVSSNPPTDGTKLVLKPPTLGDQGQIWKFQDDGHIESSLDSSLVMSIDTAKIVLKIKQTPPPESQLWYALHKRQYIFNKSSSSLVLDGGVSDTPDTNAICSTQKNTYDAGQLWYFAGSRIVCDKNGMVLTIKGGKAAADTEVVMESLDPKKSEIQTWKMDGQQIQCGDGKYVLDVSNGNVIIASPDSSRDSQNWQLLDPQHADNLKSQAISHLSGRSANYKVRRPRNPHPKPMSATTTTRYEITMFTSNTWFSGTNSMVEIALLSEDESTDTVQLTNSNTNDLPFQRGQRDKFVVDLASIGVLTGMRIEYGKGNFLNTSTWGLDEIQVYDPILGYFYSKTLGNYSTSVPQTVQIPFDRAEQIVLEGTKIAVCKYPAENYEWIFDHVYAYLETDRVQSGKIYFDAAGGHSGSPVTEDILVSHATVDAAVKMSTGYNIDAEHPLKDVYGHNDVTGKETCGLRASGRINWDGQCHNIINRLMHAALPPRRLDDADKVPSGYGLSRIVFGVYGVGFDDWCSKNGFSPPARNEGLELYGYVQRFGNKYVKPAYYYATELQESLKSNPNSKPDGEEVKTFVTSVHNAGVDNATLAKMTNLTEEEIAKIDL